MCVVSILRIVAFDSSNQDDPTYTTINTAMWSSVEQSLGIICACLPTLRPLFRQLYDASQYSLDKGSGSHSNTQFTPIRLSRFEPPGNADDSTVSFARMATNGTRSRASSTPQAPASWNPGWHGVTPSIETGDVSYTEFDGVERDPPHDMNHA